LTPQLTLIDNKNKRASQTNKNKTPIQIANNKDYLTKRRLNMSEELANIENERLANFRSNKKNNIKNDKETLKQRKIKYLKEFNSSINGPLNEEDWVGQAKNYNKMFGGISIILIGDPGQLLPVKGSTLYDQKLNNQMSIAGFLAYKAFKIVIQLQVAMR